MERQGQNRIIMEFEGEQHGPLLIVIAAIHGNEKAGITALELVEKMLEVEPVTNPDFLLRGKILGIVGNISATSRSVRYVDQDLNRMWITETIKKIKNKNHDSKNHEERELSELLSFFRNELKSYNPTELYILDLHTTSSAGGIFAIPNNDPESLEIAKNLHAPVILHMLHEIKGTTLHYFNRNHFTNLKVTATTFEAGQHDDPISINRCIAAIVNCLRSIGCVNQEDVENIHDKVLVAYSKNLPKLSELLYRHQVRKEDNFKMREGYNNFDPVQKGQILADDRSGVIRAKLDGLILMPLYQDQGEDGFFLIHPL